MNFYFRISSLVAYYWVGSLLDLHGFHKNNCLLSPFVILRIVISYISVITFYSSLFLKYIERIFYEFKIILYDVPGTTYQDWKMLVRNKIQFCFYLCTPILLTKIFLYFDSFLSDCMKMPKLFYLLLKNMLIFSVNMNFYL